MKIQRFLFHQRSCRSKAKEDVVLIGKFQLLQMEKCRIIAHLILAAFAIPAFGQGAPQSSPLPNPRVQELPVTAGSVTVVHLRPGYVSAVRVPEDVSSVVLGDPHNFAAEHSESEPRLVFIKSVGSKPVETNVLITTRTGHEIPLHLVSGGNGQVDFLLDFQLPRGSFLIAPTAAGATLAETRSVGSDPVVSERSTNDRKATSEGQLLKQVAAVPQWEGKAKLQVAIGTVATSDSKTVVSFSVLNNSAETIELLPPQVQLSGRSKDHGNKAKAEPVAVESYTLTQRKLAPHQRADGVAVFLRPAFKEAEEQLFLQIAEADAVDKPVLVPIAFTAPLQVGRTE